MRNGLGDTGEMVKKKASGGMINKQRSKFSVGRL